MKPIPVLDILVGLYLLVWTIVGLIVLIRTLGLSSEDATKWGLGWIRDFGRTWVASALAAVALWLGVPSAQGNVHPETARTAD